MSLQEATPKINSASGAAQGSETTAQTSQPGAAPQPQGAAGGMSLVTLLPLFAVMAFMLFTSSRKQKKEAEARAALKRGERVVTNAGLIGDLVEMDEKVAKVKIAAGVTVSVLASTLSSFESKSADAKADAKIEDAKVADKKG